ncbi:MAG: DUF2069 domain-containing protein, partial [Aquabacterium sp.]|uniref:DUF2069 domain-containing protein n=1 Tax=Aquabacterium sp. TaxID=1872578 RepID=UPI002A36DA25
MNTSSLPPSADNETPDPDTFIAHHPPERQATIERLRLLCVTALVSLIALGVAWELWLAPLPQGTGMLALKVLPLCLGVEAVTAEGEVWDGLISLRM